MTKPHRLVSSFVLATSMATAIAAAQDPEPLENPIPEAIADGRIRIVLQTVSEGLTAPNWGTAIPGCNQLQNRLIVTDQNGILWTINLINGEKSVLLDISGRLVALGVAGPGTFDERGLLGVAFHPAFADNGLLYTYTSEPVNGAADFSTLPDSTTANHQSVIIEWQVPDPCDPASVVDPTTARELLRIDQPQFNHDAGALNFGPDGMLYIALGDGGAADDQGVGHVPGGNGQAPDNILGTIVRIDPLGNDSTNGQYGIPTDNPFVEGPGLDEIFAYGFRNPFRFSFDGATGDLYAADVGQNDIEEVNRVTAGGNYGWRIKEGSFCFDPNGSDPGFVFECGPDDAPAGLVDPIAEYDHDEGIAVVGGFVYRGARIPPLMGRYVFGDFLSPAAGGGRLFYLERNGRIFEFPLADRDNLGLSLLGFGRDAFGELYVLANQTGTPFGETGVVLRMSWSPGPFRPGQNRGRMASLFMAHLNGDQEVPPVETFARGQAIFRFDRDISEMVFKLIVVNIEDVVAAHVHCAPAGVNGPVGVTLFSGGPIEVNGILAAETATAPDAGNGCGWESLTEVRNAMADGAAYVNVHTLAHPPGEIRGQIR